MPCFAFRAGDRTGADGEKRIIGRKGGRFLDRFQARGCSSSMGEQEPLAAVDAPKYGLGIFSKFEHS
jgi:hypothetical protein